MPGGCIPYDIDSLTSPRENEAMFFYIVQRILASVPVVLIVALFVFSLLYFTPGDPAAILAGDQATPEQIAVIRESLNLDQPYFVRFFGWLGQLAQGDLGTSIYSNRPVIELMGQRLETTLSLSLLGMLIAIVIAVPLGVLAAWKRDTWVDRTVMVVAVLAFSVPIFVTGYCLAWAFGLQLGWLPVQGYRPLSAGFSAWFGALLLPALALSSSFIGLLARMTRATMLEILSQDYIRTARAKGLDARVVLFSHALRNAAVPITTVVGLGIANLISGSVLIESVFALPGLGRMVADAILRRDYPVIQAMILIFGLTYVVINLIVDLLYTVFDPRVRY